MVLRLARVAQRMTQRELATLSGLSQSLVTKIENGRVKNPRPEVRLALAKALQQPPDLLLTSEEMDAQDEKDGLMAMLVRCGVAERAAGLIVQSIRARSRSKIRRELEDGSGGAS